MFIQHHQGFSLAGESDLVDVSNTVGAHHISQQTDEVVAVSHRVKLHEAIVPNVVDGTALAIDERKFLIVDGSLNIGTAQIHADIHSVSSLWRKGYPVG